MPVSKTSARRPWLAGVSTATSQTFKIQYNAPFTEEDLESVVWSDRAMFIGCGDEKVYISINNGQSWRMVELKRGDGTSRPYAAPRKGRSLPA